MTHERLTLLAIVVAIHMVGLAVLARSTSRPMIAQQDKGMLVTAFLRPRIRDQGTETDSVDMSRLLMRSDPAVSSLSIDIPPIDFEVARNQGARSAAPSLKQDAQVNMHAFLRQAALLQGEGATVVLRIEVLESGEPGRVEVDASSGSTQVDQAAVDYARTLRWYAGRMNGVPHSMWIRWGVRLQA
jgi:TonB family protein